MAKGLAQDVPAELKPWVKVFEQITYRYDYSRVFEDWLDLAICCMAMQTREAEYLEIIKRYQPAEQKLLAQLFAEYIMLMDSRVCNKKPLPAEYEEATKEFEQYKGYKESTEAVPWYDALGCIYEAVSSHGKKQGLGQFFTPEPVVDMMVRCLNYDGGTLMEPCCGSGRMIIAAHCYKPGPAVKIGCDLDSICVKMAGLNMAMHGVRGEVICCNSLDPTDFRFGFVTNPRIYQPGIYTLKKENSFYYKNNILWLADATEKAIEAKQQAAAVKMQVDVSAAPPAKEVKEKAKEIQEQLKLF